MVVVGGLAIHGAIVACETVTKVGRVDAGEAGIAHAAPSDCTSWEVQYVPVPVAGPNIPTGKQALTAGWEPFATLGGSLVLRRCN